MRPSTLVSGLLFLASSASAQPAWKPYVSGGFGIAEAKTVIMQAGRNGNRWPRDYVYSMAGPAIDAGIDRRLFKRGSLRLGATWLAGDGLTIECHERSCGESGHGYLAASTLSFHRTDRHAWGPTVDVGLAGLHIRSHGGPHANRALETAGGGAWGLSVSAPAIRHFAPVLSFRHLRLRTGDGRTIDAAALGLALQSR